MKALFLLFWVISPSLQSLPYFSQPWNEKPIQFENIDLLKENAFQVLSNKCNTCHSKMNRKRIFTLNNMNPWSKDIYSQVFIKKRMPKGKKTKLTLLEYQELLAWINSVKK